MKAKSLHQLKRKRKQILAIAKKHGASRVRVFGSVARGQDTPSSDIDLLVRLADKPSPWFPAGMTNELETLLGRRVEIVTEQGLNPISANMFSKRRFLYESGTQWIAPSSLL